MGFITPIFTFYLNLHATGVWTLGITAASSLDA
jgi:hypothetical protein